MTPKLKIMVIDDHPIACAGTSAIIDAQPDMVVQQTFCNWGDALQAYDPSQVDIVICDLRLHETSGIDFITALHAKDPQARVLIVSGFSLEEEIHACMEAGAAGYVTKSTSATNLLLGIRQIAKGEQFLSPDASASWTQRQQRPPLRPRELEVLQLASQGLSNKLIADRLGISEATVKQYMSQILERMNVRDRAHAVTEALRRGLIAGS